MKGCGAGKFLKVHECKQLKIVASCRNINPCVLEVAQMPVVAQNRLWKLLTDARGQGLQSDHEALGVSFPWVPGGGKEE